MGHHFSRRGLRTCGALAALGLVSTLAGCLDWQGTYDESARNQCRALPNTSDREACMDSVARNSAQKRSDQNGH